MVNTSKVIEHYHWRYIQQIVVMQTLQQLTQLRWYPSEPLELMFGHWRLYIHMTVLQQIG